MQSRYLCSLALAALTSALLGCSGSAGGHANSQVVARANGQEISLHQVNFVLAKAGEIPADKLETVRKGVLDRLIDEELLASKAVEAKLDRTPETLMALEMARKEILARAYAEHVVASGPKLDPGDIVRYYALHGELFENRQVFALEETQFPATGDSAAQVRALVEQKTPVEKIREYLHGKDIQFKVHSGFAPAERVPPQLLKRLEGAHAGDLVLTEENGNVSLVRVAAIRKEPVDEATATPAIRRLLANQHAAKLTEQELKQLKAKAKIEYLGPFANAKPAVEGSAAGTQGTSGSQATAAR